MEPVLNCVSQTLFFDNVLLEALQEQSVFESHKFKTEPLSGEQAEQSCHLVFDLQLLLSLEDVLRRVSVLDYADDGLGQLGECSFFALLLL